MGSTFILGEKKSFDWSSIRILFLLVLFYWSIVAKELIYIL